MIEREWTTTRWLGNTNHSTEDDRFYIRVPHTAGGEQRWEVIDKAHRDSYSGTIPWEGGGWIDRDTLVAAAKEAAEACARRVLAGVPA